MRHLWRTLLLGWRKLGFAFLERLQVLWCAFLLGLRNPCFTFPERDANPVAHTHSALAKPKFCIPGAKGEPHVAHSFWAGETRFACPERDAIRMEDSPSGLAELGFAFPERDASPMVGPNHSGINVGCLTAPVCVNQSASTFGLEGVEGARTSTHLARLA